MTKLNTNEARQGSTPHVTRHVLAWGLGLVIVGFLLAWLFFK